MSALWERIKAQPILVTTLVQTILILVVSFGLKVSPEQTAAIIAVTGALLAIVAASGSTPVSAPTLPSGSVVTVTTPAGQPNEVKTV